MSKPTYNIEDKVRVIKGKMLSDEAEVVGITRGFQELEDNGEFRLDGLMIMEDTIDSMSVDVTIEGDILSYESEQPYMVGNELKTRKELKRFGFFKYLYTVKTDSYNLVVSDNELELI